MTPIQLITRELEEYEDHHTGTDAGATGRCVLGHLCHAAEVYGDGGMKSRITKLRSSLQDPQIDHNPGEKTLAAVLLAIAPGREGEEQEFAKRAICLNDATSFADATRVLVGWLEGTPLSEHSAVGASSV